jgi:hypothetical protein
MYPSGRFYGNRGYATIDSPKAGRFLRNVTGVDRLASYFPAQNSMRNP